jgi:hypothetical protein
MPLSRMNPFSQDEIEQINTPDVMPEAPATIPASMPNAANNSVVSPFVPTSTQSVSTTPQTAPFESEQTMTSTVRDPAINNQLLKAQNEQHDAIIANATAKKQENELLMQAYSDVSKEIGQKKSEFDAAVNEFKDKKVINPQSQWGTMEKIGAAIAMGLGAYAATYTGGRNHAADIINSAIDRDIALQETQIKKLGANVDMTKNALAQAYSKFGDLEQAKSAITIAALIDAKQDVINTAKKIDNDKIDANSQALLGALDEKIATVKMQNQDKRIIQTTIKGGKKDINATGGKPLTEAQAKENVFATAMANADKELAKHEKYATSITGAAATSRLMPEATRPEQAKLYNQAASAWQEAYDRFASGAAISEAERGRTIARAMPQVSDSEKVLQQKREYRREIQNQIRQGIYGNANTIKAQAEGLKVNNNQYGFKPQ